GADLRRAGDRAAGEGRLEDVDRAEAAAERALDCRHQVVDRRMALERLGRGDLHASVLADAAEVVPLEVDDHGELGVVLEAGVKLLPEGLVLVVVGAAAARPLDGARDEGPAAEAEELLRGRGANGAPAE